MVSFYAIVTISAFVTTVTFALSKKGSDIPIIVGFISTAIIFIVGSFVFGWPDAIEKIAQVITGQ